MEAAKICKDSGNFSVKAASRRMEMLPSSVKIQVPFHAVKAASRRIGMLPRSVKIQVTVYTVKAVNHLCHMKAYPTIPLPGRSNLVPWYI